MGVADFVALGAIHFAGGFGLALDESGVRGKFLDGLEALDITDFIENGQRQDAPLYVFAVSA